MALGDYLPWRKGEAAAGGGHPLSRLQGEMNALFESFFRQPAAVAGTGFAPDADIVETRDAVHVTIELPGVEPADVNVTIADEAVTIQGEKRGESKREEEGYVRIERTYGRFERTIPLPVEIEVDRAEATFKNGVLTVVLPKAEASKRHVRRIDIRTE